MGVDVVKYWPEDNVSNLMAYCENGKRGRRKDLFISSKNERNRARSWDRPVQSAGDARWTRAEEDAQWAF